MFVNLRKQTTTLPPAGPVFTITCSTLSKGTSFPNLPPLIDHLQATMALLTGDKGHQVLLTGQHNCDGT